VRRLPRDRGGVGEPAGDRRDPDRVLRKVDPCAALRTGERLAPLDAALYAFLDEAYGTGFGQVVPAPSVRH
jgi:hypothetical protein